MSSRNKAHEWKSRLKKEIKEIFGDSDAPIETPSPITSGTAAWVKSDGWANLRELLSTISDGVTFTALGPVKSIVEGLVDCIQIYENEAQGRKEYQELQAQLERIFDELKKYLSSSPVITTSIATICGSIQKELDYVKDQQARTAGRRLGEAEMDADNVLECYRRIQDHLQRLSRNANISTWIIVDQLATDNRLQKLSPLLWESYNSTKATEIKRGPCAEGTCTSILAQIIQWATGPDTGIYWMSGMAGTGKTTIAYSLCEQLDIEPNRMLCASFFCSRLLPECRDVGRIIPSIAYQLAECSRPFRHMLSQVLEKDPDAHTRSLQLQFDSLIVRPLSDVQVREAFPTRMVAVIDALDECEDTSSAKRILEVLLTASKNIPIKFVVSSRPEAAIRQQMENSEDTRVNSKVILHELNTGEVQADIETYLRAKLAPIEPSDLEIITLVERAGVLFIYAATAVRYVGYDNFGRNARSRLNAILGISKTQGAAQTGELDQLYGGILELALREDEFERMERDDMKLILSTVVCAKAPLTVDALNRLLNLSDVERVKAALRPLWPVLHVIGPEMKVMTLHASFPEYLTDPSRTGNSEWQYNAVHNILAQRCFECIRNTRPQFNICRLKSSYLNDDKVEDLVSRVQKYITLELRYACLYWSAHLVMSDSSVTPVQLALLEQFLSHNLLLWMEVMNLTKNIATSSENLTIAKEWAARHSTSRELVNLIQEAWCFAFTVVSSSISESTPHIYVSMLPFLPLDSPIRKHYAPRMYRMIDVESKALDQRKPLLVRWSLEYSDYITFSPDGTLLVMSPDCLRKSLYIIDTSNGRLIRDIFHENADQHSCIAISPDNTRVAFVSEPNIWLCDIASGRPDLGPVDVDQAIYSIVFSHDGSHLITGSSDGLINIWNAHSGKSESNPLVGHTDRVVSLAISSDGTKLISGSRDCTICVWDMQNRCLMNPISGHTSDVAAVAISYNNTFIVSGSHDKSVRVWDSSTGHALFEPFFHETWVGSVAISPDGAFITTGLLDGTIQIWSATTGKAVSPPLTETGYSVKALRHSSNGARIISYSTSFLGPSSGILSLFDAQIAINRRCTLSGHTEPILSIDISPNGKYIVSGSSDKRLFVWDVVGGQPVLGPLTGHGHWVNFVKYSPDGRRFLSCSSDEPLLQWDAQIGELIQSTKPIAPISTGQKSTSLTTQSYKGYCSAAYSPNGSRIATILYDVCVWNSASGEMILGPMHGDAEGLLVEFSSDGANLIVGWGNGIVKTWDSYSGQLLSDIKCPGNITTVSALAFSSDHSYAALADLSNDKKRILYTRMTRKEMGPPEHFGARTASTCSVRFSHDDTCIVSGSKDGTVHIWDTQLRVSIYGPLKGHIKRVNSVAFSPDGTYAASASDDSTIRVWDATAQSGPSLSAEWVLNKDGWVLDKQSRRLIWVPPEFRGLLIWPRNRMVLSGNGYVRLRFEGALIGDKWVNCWRGN